MISPVEFHGAHRHFNRVTAVLDEAAENPTQGGGGKVVTAAMIAEAKRRTQETCRCDELGLRPGISRTRLNQLGGGCKSPSYACSVLVKIRREMEQ